MDNKVVRVNYEYLNQVSEHLSILGTDIRNNIGCIFIHDMNSTISTNQYCQQAYMLSSEIENEIASLLEMDREYVRKYGIEFGNLDSELLSGSEG